MSLNRRHFLGSTFAAGALAGIGLPASAGQKMPNWHAGYRTAPAGGYVPGPLKLVHGTPPKSLRGSLFRNGPAQFRYGDAYATHWFDGDGMIQRIHIEDGAATHAGQFVQTPKRQAEQAAGRFLASGFGTVGDESYPIESSDDVNAANTSVIMAGDDLLALWEGGSPWRLDPVTLESKGAKVLRDDLKGMPYLAHPKVEPDGRIWNLGASGSRIAIYLMGSDGVLQDFGMADMGAPAYIHDWAMTDRHLVILVQPWLYTRNIPPFVDGLEWRPEEGLKILIVDKDDFTQTRWVQAPPRAFYHTGAAWAEADGTIKVDVAFYNTPVLGSEGASAEIQGEWSGQKDELYISDFSMLVIPPTGDAHIQSTGIDGEFPQVVGPWHGLPRRLTAMVAGSTSAHPGARQLCVQDWETGAADMFNFGDDRIVEEFLFVPQPGGTSEHDSWLIGPVLNIKAQAHEIHVFDAANVSDGPVCIWQADYAWPLGFHGTWA